MSWRGDCSCDKDSEVQWLHSYLGGGFPWQIIAVPIHALQRLENSEILVPLYRRSSNLTSLTASERDDGEGGEEQERKRERERETRGQRRTLSDFWPVLPMTASLSVTVVGSMETAVEIQMEKTELRHMAKYTNTVIKAERTAPQGRRTTPPQSYKDEE